MKKLMIALAAVAMAAGVQASQFDWKITYDGNIDGAVAYVFKSTDKAAVTAILDDFTSASDLMSYALKAGESPSSITGVASEKREVWTTNFSPATTAKGVTSADSVFTVIFQGDIAKGTAYLMSDNIAIADYVYEDGSGSPQDLNIKNASLTISGTIGPSGPGPVPEPTSGLLLLLGVAGLALKRKRA